MHTLDKQLELHNKLREAGFLTVLDDVNEMTEDEVDEMVKDFVKVELPFAGFYESIHDSEITRVIEERYTYDYEKDEDREITEEESEAIWSAGVNWDAIRQEFCQNYAEAFGDHYGLNVKYDDMTSPREYNYGSDRLFVKIPREQINEIRKEVEKHKDWPGYIKYKFTDRSGFWSNYDSDYQHEDWTKDTLDECQYMTILRFWLDNISEDRGIDGWRTDQYHLLEDFEMCNWDSIIEAQEVVDKYIKENL